MKRFISLMLSATLIFSSAIEVSADEMVAEEAQIVVNDEIEGAFSAQVSEAGYDLTLNAPAGVFPVGTDVAVAKVSDEREAEVAELVAATLSDDETIAQTVTFDIEFTTPDGEVVEPENGTVSIAVASDDAFAVEENSAIAVYHVADDDAIEQVAVLTADEIAENGVSFDAAEFSSYTLVVINPNKPDTKAPVLKSAKLKNATYTNGSTKVPTITAKMTDDLSGVDYGYFVFYSANKKDYIGISVGTPAGKDTYKGSMTNSNYYKPGKYTLEYVWLYDKVDNRKRIDKKNLKVLTITVKDSSSGIKASMSDISYNPDTLEFASYENYKSSNATMKIKVSSGKLDHIILEMTESKTKKTTQKYVWPSSIGNGVYTGSVGFNNSKSNSGTWKVTGVTFYGENNASCSQTGSKLPKAVTSKKLTVKATGTTGPQIKEMTFEESKVTMGKKDLTVKATVSANVKLNYAWARLYDKKNNRYLYSDKNEVNPDGTVTLYFVIKKNQPSVSYVLDMIDISDENYNYVYYGSYSDYEPLTPTLKKVKLTVKNTYKK